MWKTIDFFIICFTANNIDAFSLLFFHLLFLNFPIIRFRIIIKLLIVSQAWIFEFVSQVIGDSVLDTLSARLRVTGIFHSSVSSTLASGVVIFPDHQKEGVHLSQEGQSLSLGHQPPPLHSLPLSPGLSKRALCFDLYSEVSLVSSPLPPRFPSSHRNLESRLCPEVGTETAAR